MRLAPEGVRPSLGEKALRGSEGCWGDPKFRKRNKPFYKRCSPQGVGMELCLERTLWQLRKTNYQGVNYNGNKEL